MKTKINYYKLSIALLILWIIAVIAIVIMVSRSSGLCALTLLPTQFNN